MIVSMQPFPALEYRQGLSASARVRSGGKVTCVVRHLACKEVSKIEPGLSQSFLPEVQIVHRALLIAHVDVK